MAGGVLIVDDEPLARERLQRLLEKHGGFERIMTASDGIQAIGLIEKAEPDVVFLDVQMAPIDGFEVIEQVGLDKMPQVVFVTAYDQYAIRAFDVHAVDYLLKPYTEQRFLDTLQRLQSSTETEQLESLRGVLDETRTTRYRDRIIVRHKDELIIVRTADVDWIEAANNYVRIVAGKASYLLREGISAMEAQLDPSKFARIHRSTIVNVDRIRSMKPWFSGDYLVNLDNGKQLRLSRTHRDKLARVIGESAALTDT